MTIISGAVEISIAGGGGEMVRGIFLGILFFLFFSFFFFYNHVLFVSRYKKP